jgi:hypothetical protein
MDGCKTWDVLRNCSKQFKKPSLNILRTACKVLVKIKDIFTVLVLQRRHTPCAPHVASG